MAAKPDNLEQLLQQLRDTPGDARVALDDIIHAVGHRGLRGSANQGGFNEDPSVTGQAEE